MAVERNSCCVSDGIITNILLFYTIQIMWKTVASNNLAARCYWNLNFDIDKIGKYCWVVEINMKNVTTCNKSNSKWSSPYHLPIEKFIFHEIFDKRHKVKTFLLRFGDFHFHLDFRKCAFECIWLKFQFIFFLFSNLFLVFFCNLRLCSKRHAKTNTKIRNANVWKCRVSVWNV
jgi:hypothetical protein